MLSFEEARHLVLTNQKDFGTEEVDLLQSTGKILAHDVFADRDFPPYNRVMMDGIALNSADYNRGVRTFPIEKIQAAGSQQVVLENSENCIEVMTGAMLPLHTDVVIPYEQCEITGGKASILADKVTKMQHVHLQGTDSKKEDLLVEKWKEITPAVIGILASVGVTRVSVLSLPKITICSTGDELVDVTEQPEAHQVRRSNVYMLAAALLAEGITASTMHLPDDPALMTTQIEALIKTNDVILFSGAVSKGKFDHLPAVLEKLGMQQIFHKVAQRPGKPFLFGKFAEDAFVFGFPGNPVSTFVCYQQFFKPWLRSCVRKVEQVQYVMLAKEVNFEPPLTCHLLGKISNDHANVLFTPVPGSTSGDMVTLLQANAIVTLPANRNLFAKNEVFKVNLLD